MDVQVKLWLQDGHTWEFCCDEDDPVLFGLASALPGANLGSDLPADGLIQIKTRTGECLFLTRSSLVAMDIVPITPVLGRTSGYRTSIGSARVLHVAGAETRNEISEPNFNSLKQIPRFPRIDFAITTVARPGDYIHALISRLRVDLGLSVVVGGAECEYLKRYRDKPFIDIIEPAPQEWGRFRDCVVHQRAAWTYWRTLVLDVQHLDRKGLVVFEDDVIPAANWEPRLYETSSRLKRSKDAGTSLLCILPTVCQNRKKTEVISFPIRWTIFLGLRLFTTRNRYARLSPSI